MGNKDNLTCDKCKIERMHESPGPARVRVPFQEFIRPQGGPTEGGPPQSVTVCPFCAGEWLREERIARGAFWDRFFGRG